MINSSETSTCRICFKSSEKLMTPCLCRGVFAFVHQSCLAHWLEETKSEYCDICRFKYKTIKCPKNLVDWITKQTRERHDYISSIVVYVFLLYFLTFGSIIWFHSLGRINIALTLLLLLVTLCLGTLTLTSLCSFLGEEFISYRKWIKSNFRITVLNNPDNKVEPPTPPRRVVRSSGVSKGSRELNYKSSSSSEGL